MSSKLDDTQILPNVHDPINEALQVNVVASTGLPPGKAEDSPHVSGDVGQMVLAVRNDAGVALAGDGDYTALSTDATGALRVAASFTESATAAEGAATPAQVKVVAGEDSGNLVRVLKTDAAGELQVDVLTLPAVTATDLDIRDLIHTQDSVRIGDGVDLALVTAAGELSVLASAQPGVDLGDVTVNNAAGAGAVNVQDGGNSLTVDGTVAATQSGTWNINNVSGTISLPTGASTLAEQQTQTTSLQLLDDTVATTGAAITTKGLAAAGTDGTNARILKTDAAGELQVDVLTLPAVTATDLDIRDLSHTQDSVRLGDGTDLALVTAAGELNVLASAQPGVDVGDVTINNAAGAAAVNVQDGGNSLTVDGTVTANIGTTGGLALNATLTDASQKTQIVDGAGNVIGSTANALDVNIKSGVTLEVNLDNANDDVLVYGWDGAANQKIKTDVAGELQVDVLSSALPTGAASLAEQQTQTTALQLLDDAVATTGAAITAKGFAVSGTDGTNARILKTDSAGELQVDVLTLPAITATDLDIRDLSHTQDSVRLGDGTDLALVTAAGELNVLASAQPGVDIGDVTINNAAGAAAVNIQDGGNSITVDGTVAVTATDLDIRNLSHTQDSVRIGDGTDLALVTAAGELNVISTAQPGVDIGDVTINNAAGGGAVNIQDGGNSITVDGTVTATATDFDIRDLTHVSDSVKVGDGTDFLAISAAGAASVSVVDPLPAGTNNIGDVDVLSVLPGTGALNLGKAEDSVHTSGDVGVMALAVRNDAGTPFAADGDYVPLSTDSTGAVRVAGSFSAAYLDVVDFMDTPVLDTATTSIPASSGSPLEVVASLAADVKKIKINDTTGFFVRIFTGAAASEVLQVISGPGEDQTIEVQMLAGQRVSIRHDQNVAISNEGEFCIQFIG